MTASRENDLYPPSPETIPVELTRPTMRYRVQVAVVLVSLFVFLALYVALVAASGWLVWQAIVAPLVGRGFYGILLKLGSIGAAGMLFVFLLKGLFTMQRDDRSDLIEVQPSEEPRLFDFLRRLSAETGAPMPKHVYLSAEVNAAVFYDSSVLSLFLPVRKNLLIGLGLVNALNLSELKAVLGHELGHFSQGTMRVGSYVYVANRIIADIVFSRDKWDDLLDAWRRQDVRIAIFGWILTAIVWTVRKVLQGAFKAINLVNAALMRQMEFDADRMAVRVAGSDAIIVSLLRSRFADACLGQSIHDLRHAGDHGLFTDDLFVHQTAAGDWLRRLRKKPDWGDRPSIPSGDAARAFRVFHPDDPEEPPPSMWASHPPDAEREAGAKAIYVPCTIEERSAWALFQDAPALRRKVTRQVVERWNEGRAIELREAAEVQRFIDDEREETTFDARYHDAYEGRFIAPGDVEGAFDSEPVSLEALLAEEAALFGDELAAVMGAQRTRLDEARQIGAALAAGPSGAVRVRGERVSRADAEARMAAIDEHLTADRSFLEGMDEDVLRVYSGLAAHLDALEDTEAWSEELRHRYEFHLGIQSLANAIGPIHDTLESGLSVTRDGRNLEREDFQHLLECLDRARDGLVELLGRAESLVFPRLRNMSAGDALRDFLLQRPVIESHQGGDSVDGEWIRLLVDQLAEVEDKLRRLFFKSMGGLLACQEEIAGRCREHAPRSAGVAEASPSSPPPA